MHYIGSSEVSKASAITDRKLDFKVTLLAVS